MPLPDEPDLTRELDAAEEIVMGRAESVVTEWGVRRADGIDIHCASEYLARLNAAGKNGVRTRMASRTTSLAGNAPKTVLPLQR